MTAKICFEDEYNHFVILHGSSGLMRKQRMCESHYELETWIKLGTTHAYVKKLLINSTLTETL